MVLLILCRLTTATWPPHRREAVPAEGQAPTRMSPLPGRHPAEPVVRSADRMIVVREPAEYAIAILLHPGRA